MEKFSAQPESDDNSRPGFYEPVLGGILKRPNVDGNYNILVTDIGEIISKMQEYQGYEVLKREGPTLGIYIAVIKRPDGKIIILSEDTLAQPEQLP